MRRVFTSTLFGVMLLSGCAGVPLPSIPLPGLNAPEPREVSVETPAESPVRAPANVPRIRSGNEALFARATELMMEGKPDAAEVLLLELTESQPELAGPWVNLGIIHQQRNDSGAAIQAYESALIANPDNCDALNQLGVLARQAGDFSAAESYYTACVRSQPDYAAAHLNLAVLYELYMGRLTEALVSYHEYQLAVTEPDNQVAGWVVDLERRVSALAKR